MLAKQSKDLAAAQKKLDATTRKQAAAAAAAGNGQKSAKKAALKDPQKAAKKLANPHKKVAIQKTNSEPAAEPKNRPTMNPPVASTLAAATELAIRSRSGRTLSRPSRFED